MELQMLYDYQYTVAAIITLAVLFVISYQRRSFSNSKSNLIYFRLLYCNFFAAVLDLFTFFTISYPQNYSPFVRYASNCIYLFVYELLVMTFVKYISALTHAPKPKRLSGFAYFAVLTVDAILLLTTPFTHLIFYFDGQLSYRHGILIWVLFVPPIVLLMFSIIACIYKKYSFSSFQLITMAMIFIIMVIYSVVQLYLPRLDMGTFMLSLVLVIIYAVFENSAYYTYMHTKCLNRRAFSELMQEYARTEQNAHLMLLTIDSRPENGGIHAENEFNETIIASADLLSRCYGKNIFFISGSKFILLLDQEDAKSETDIRSEIASVLRKYQERKHLKSPLSFRIRGFYLHEIRISDDYVDHLIEMLIHSDPDVWFSDKTPEKLLFDQHIYREIEDAVQNAINEERIFVNYQPIFDTQQKRIRSAEILVRLNDPYLGAISPDVFIPIAEKKGNIFQLGEIVFRKLCDFIVKNDPPSIGIDYIEINFSMIQFGKPGLADHYIEILREYGISPSLFNIELTESAQLLTDKTVSENTEKFAAAGFAFAIDDYGSGFASSDYLFRLPFELVKIDKSLIWAAAKDPNAMIVLRNSMRTIHELNKKIVVEGVEDQQMVDIVYENHGEFIQGYFYSKPLKTDDFIKFVRAFNGFD